MARKQKLINYHGSDKSKLYASALTAGEIAVVHNSEEPLLGTKVGDNVVFFASSGAVDTAINNVVTNINNVISGLDLTEVYEEGKPIVGVSQTDGKVSARTGNIAAANVTVADSDNKLTATTVEGALAELADKAAAITVSSSDSSITVTNSTAGTDVVVNVDGTTVVKNADGSLKSNLEVVKLNETELNALSDANCREAYKLIYSTDTNRNAIGDVVKVYKDQTLKSAEYTNQNLVLTYVLADGSESAVTIDMSSLILETEVENGIQAIDHKLSIKLDTTGDDTGDGKFLTVGANGLKLDGVTDAINAAVDALDVTDTAEDGKYVSAVNETNGKVSMTRANVSDAVLNGYAKGEKPASTALAATDDVKGALAKLEHQVDDAKAAATTKVVEGTDTGNNMTIVSTTSETDSSVTYTINLTDVASAQGLADEITARTEAITNLSAATVNAIEAEKTARENQDNTIEASVGLAADGSHTTTSGNYTSAATTVVGEIAALDTALKAVSDKLNDAKVTEGASVENFVTLTLDTATTAGTTALTINDTALSGKLATIDTALDAEIAARKAVDGQNGQTYVANTNANYISEATSLNDADVKLDAALKAEENARVAAINGLNKEADVVAGQVVTTVSEVSGVVSETKANVKDLQLGGYVKDTAATGDIAGTDTINAALSKLENKAAAITIANADGSINVTTGANGTDINVNIKSGEHVLAKTGDAGLYTDLDLVKITTGLPETVKERYQLLATDDSQIGVNIDIPKDSHIVSIDYITDTADTHYQNLEYTYVDASGATQTTYVDMSELVLEAEFASGVTATNGVVHGVVDGTSEAFLTVGADGFKLSGVQDAIDAKVNALDVTDDAAVAGQYVAAIEETDGVVAVKTRANVSEAVLNNYAKGTDATAVAATDTVNQAVSKLENQIDKAKAAATTKVVEGTDAGNNMTITPTTGADGSVTYTVDLADVASATALTKEISDRADGDAALLGNSANTSSDNTIFGLRKALAEVKAGLVDSISGDNTLISATTTSGTDGETVTISATQKLTDAVAKAEVAPTGVTFGALESVVRDEHNSGVNATISGNTLTLDLDELVVDCGEF